MRYEETQSFLNIYTENPDVCQLVILVDDKNRLLGRALLWKLIGGVNKYGYYLECGQLRKSLKTIKINVPFKEIKIDDALTILKDCDSETNGLVRKISNELAIRKGKFGDYLFYKTPTMKKPQFLKLDDFNEDYKNCSLEFLKSWIKDKYGL